MKPPWALRLSVNTCKCYFSKLRCFLNIFVGVFITGEARETSHLIQTHSNQKKGSLQAVEEALKVPEQTEAATGGTGTDFATSSSQGTSVPSY